MENHEKEEKGHGIDFTVDGETLTTEKKELSVREILSMANVDSQQYYLVEVKGHQQEPHKDLDEVIKMHNHMKFVTVFTGQTPVG
ncbi:MAG: hypothetical protein A2845_05905 [Candidatus Lloydbacteria bacterium RIFCSPHIGHO2_01_FULL_49_22]|uniref:Multi-ubiquitin domain-containing protein n=1 Tax=Candidatus Lloydbacteria bacterium RIFCSPHIGHO2_01_FULL_49_22 TaxID=1798658 RepID=A0A1G2CW99_9BACT|nr:MAG: hypothetical protein A2845_05905 [Candidatus Lloydbacteria bacterium RIFCSPHIGHO2_01_FULL_49_22]OGZ09787.1 MAG: hypothetical protein A3C14_00110 [Candidatus Lloydbacteria bacterium RIFCSPHIGHO2_02_FULL_50_18]